MIILTKLILCFEKFYLWLARRSGDNNLEATSHEATPIENKPHGGIRSFVKKQTLKVVDRVKAQEHEVQGYELLGEVRSHHT